MVTTLGAFLIQKSGETTKAPTVRTAPLKVFTVRTVPLKVSTVRTAPLKVWTVRTALGYWGLHYGFFQVFLLESAR